MKEQAMIARAAESLGLTVVANDYQNNIVIVSGYADNKIIVYCFDKDGNFIHQYEV